MTTRPQRLIARAVFPQTAALLRAQADVETNDADEVWPQCRRCLTGIAHQD